MIGISESGGGGATRCGAGVGGAAIACGAGADICGRDGIDAVGPPAGGACGVPAAGDPA